MTRDINATLEYTLIQESRGRLNTGRVELPVVSFEPLTLADAGSYQCNVTVSSPFLTNDIAILSDVLEIFLESKLGMMCAKLQYQAVKSHCTCTSESDCK